MADMTAQGVDIGNAFTAAARKSEAYNALSKAYGPAIADNPENAQAAAAAAASIPLAAQNAQTTAATGQANLANTQAELPIKQAQGQNLGVAAKSAQNSLDITAGLRGLKMMQAIANPDGSIPADEARHIVSNPIYGIDQNHIEPLIQKLSQPGGTQTLGSMAQALQAGGKVSGPATVVTNPDGTTSIYRSTVNGGEVENNIGGAQTAQQQGIPIKQQNANANTYRANTGANNTAFGNPGGAPLAQRGTAAPAPGAATNPAVPVLTGKPLATRTAAAQQLAGTDVNIQNANTIANSMKSQITPYTTGAGSIMKNLPGSVAANLHANAETLRAQAAQAVLSGMKNAQGSTGVGRILQAEYKNFTNMYGNLEQDQTAKQYAFHLGLLQQSLNKMQNIQHQAFKSQYGVDHNTVLGIEPGGAAAPPALPGGWKYLGVAK